MRSLFAVSFIALCATTAYPAAAQSVSPACVASSTGKADTAALAVAKEPLGKPAAHAISVAGVRLAMGLAESVLTDAARPDPATPKAKAAASGTTPLGGASKAIQVQLLGDTLGIRPAAKVGTMLARFIVRKVREQSERPVLPSCMTEPPMTLARGVATPKRD